MKKVRKLLGVVVILMLCLSVAVPVSADDISARIAEIEAQIEELQAELKELKEQKRIANGDTYIDSAEYATLFTDASEYVGKDIKIAGKMNGTMEQDSNGKYFQMFHNLNGDSKSVLVMCDASTQDFVSGDYVLVTGEVLGTTSVENLFGGEVMSLAIKAESAEKTDYATAERPAIKALEPNLQIDQYGYVISLNKIEFAKEETRLYVTVTNNGSSKVYFSGYSTKIVQGNSQYELQYNYESNYPEVQSEILSGIESSGILAFPRIDMDTDMKIYFEAYSDDYYEELEPYVFNIAAN